MERCTEEIESYRAVPVKILPFERVICAADDAAGNVFRRD
jgi:hypothetical protein|nr:MAG TPA: hypothetical protein [Caudoviricetes sp.]